MGQVSSTKDFSHAATPATPEALSWPPPVVDSDIIWLDDDASRAPAPASSPDDAIRLSRLLIPDVPLEWHHAVAVVQQLIDQCAPDRRHAPAASVPSIDAIKLDSSARLRVQLSPGGEPFVPFIQAAEAGTARCHGSAREWPLRVSLPPLRGHRPFPTT